MLVRSWQNPIASTGFIFCFLFIAIIYAVAENDSLDAGNVRFVEGIARKQVSGSEGWLTIENGMTFSAGDSIKTLDDGRLEARLEGGGIFRVGKETIIFIAVDPSGSGALPELVFGDIWVDFPPGTDAGSDLSPLMILPTAEIITGGSIARFTAGKDCTSEIKVYGGRLKIERRKWPGDLTESQGKERKLRPCEDGQSASDSSLSRWPIDLEAGQRLILSSKGQVIFQGAFSPEDPDETTEWIRWNKDRDQIE